MPANDEEVQIRRMSNSDLTRILEIDALIFGEERAVTWAENIETLWFVQHPALNFVAEAKDQIVGFLLGDVRGAAYESNPCGWIDIIGVHPTCQGQGIGKRLVEAFCQWCQANEVKPRIIVREDDERLRTFLESTGFRRGKLVDFEK